MKVRRWRVISDKKRYCRLSPSWHLSTQVFAQSVEFDDDTDVDDGDDEDSLLTGHKAEVCLAENKRSAVKTKLVRRASEAIFREDITRK